MAQLSCLISILVTYTYGRQYKDISLNSVSSLGIHMAVSIQYLVIISVLSLEQIGVLFS